MNSKTLMKGAFLALCLIGVFVLPAAAATTAQASTGQASVIDQGLKDDLWTNHYQYRLQEFDLHVERANSVISALNTYGIDTTQMRATLATITGERAALDTAIANRDTAALKTINADLVPLWKQFIQEMKASVREHYAAARAAAKAGTDTVPAGTTAGAV
ncbi:MAG: hypothetical protein ABFC71_09525 [Methanoregula sp.]